MADSVAPDLEVGLRNGEVVADSTCSEEAVEHLAAGLAVHAVLEAQEPPGQINNQEADDVDGYCSYYPLEVRAFVNQHTASGALDRRKFVNLLELADTPTDLRFVAEIATLFISDMDAWFSKATAWVQQLPNMEEILGQPNRVAAMRVYDEFRIRLPAYVTAHMMGAQRLKDALWELRARKHAHDRQGCQTALSVAELACTEFQGVLREFIEIEHLVPIRASLVPIVRSLSAGPLSSKLLFPSNIFRAVNSRELYATAFDRMTGEED